MKQLKYRGLTKSQESAPSMSIRDTRPFLLRVYDFASSRSGSIVLILGCALMMIFVPGACDLLFLLAALVFWVSFWQLIKLPVRLPLGTKYPDPSNKNPKNHRPGKAKGIYFFANEMNTKHELWFSNEDMRTHALILGTTGSGKTQTLLSLAFNALVQGSGFIYVDGKGDNSTFAQVFSMARSMGREDDVLVINYMTGAEDIIGPQKEALSNTLNPFAIGSSSMLSQLVVSMMGSSKQSGDGDMWKGRAISFVEALMRMLVYLRDQSYFNLDSDLIRRYFSLEVLENLLEKQIAIDQNNTEIHLSTPPPKEVLDPLYNYLGTLPGYQRKNVGKQSDKTYEQHGYITMQLTRIFGSLADVYAHIMRTNLAEVDFHDVVLNRRILVVLLPALEKSPDELANLGKLIIASLKAMLASGLGSRIQGDYQEVIESKPSNTETPFLCILDEYGYYAVEGFAVVPAQARSLGFSVVFAGQDIPAFQKASKEEAASIFANTNIKICMKLEDPTETWDFFNKTAGEAYVSVAKSYNMGSNGQAYGYQDTKEATIEKRARLDLMDLKDQLAGEAHVFFQSGIYRSKMFYAAPQKTQAIRLNQFLKLEELSNGYTQCLQFTLKHNNYPLFTESTPITSQLLEALMNNGEDSQDEGLAIIEESKAWHTMSNKLNPTLQSEINGEINLTDNVELIEELDQLSDNKSTASSDASLDRYVDPNDDNAKYEPQKVISEHQNLNDMSDGAINKVKIQNVLSIPLPPSFIQQSDYSNAVDDMPNTLINNHKLYTLVYTFNIMSGKDAHTAKKQASGVETKVAELGKNYFKLPRLESVKTLCQRVKESINSIM